MDLLVEVFDGAEGPVGQMVAFEIPPASLDVVEFGGIFGQPLDGEPGTGGKRLGAELAGVDRAVVEDDDGGRLGDIRPRGAAAVQHPQQSDT